MNCQHWPPNPKAWLFRATRYRALKRLRSDRRRCRREERAQDAEADPPCLESTSATRLDAHQADLALRALPAEEREAVTLRIWGGLTLEEIAAVMGSSAPTVLRRYESAIQHLRRRLESPHPMTLRS